MHAGSLKSTQEARVALGYRLVQLFHKLRRTNLRTTLNRFYWRSTYIHHRYMDDRVSLLFSKSPNFFFFCFLIDLFKTIIFLRGTASPPVISNDPLILRSSGLYISYSQSSPCDRSRKRPALVKTNLYKTPFEL